MTEPIENEYFNWLCAKVIKPHNNNHIDLLVILHKTEFVWVVPADSHRAEDGIELRYDFLRASGIQSERAWENQPCSVLEMFIAFSLRAAFQTEIPVKTWFWEFMTNLRLNEYRTIFGDDTHRIKDIIDCFMWRQYNSNGLGGAFPMSRTENDQRKIEIWYQFCEYVDDRGLL